MVFEGWLISQYCNPVTTHIATAPTPWKEPHQDAQVIFSFVATPFLLASVVFFAKDIAHLALVVHLEQGRCPVSQSQAIRRSRFVWQGRRGRPLTTSAARITLLPDPAAFYSRACARSPQNRTAMSVIQHHVCCNPQPDHCPMVSCDLHATLYASAPASTSLCC